MTVDGQPDISERARKLFSGPIEFLKSAPKLEHLPDPTVPEIAFAGRSNVGKSSLINAVTNRAKLARASNTPGRTQELNYFDVGQPLMFRLVDMPGYGFAKAPLKVVERWKALVREFLRGRQVLKRTLVLIDSRHGVKEVDREMMKLLDEAAVPAAGLGSAPQDTSLATHAYGAASHLVYGWVLEGVRALIAGRR